MSQNTSRIRRAVLQVLSHRHLVAVGSVLFLAIFTLAGVLIYQDAYVMRDQINAEFNRQQALLAQLGVSQIHSLLRDIRLELDKLGQFLATAAKENREDAIFAVLDRTESKGLMEISLVDPKTTVERVYRPDGTISILRKPTTQRRQFVDGEEMVLGPLHVEPGNRPNTRIVTGFVCARVLLDGEPKTTLFAKLNVSALVAGAVEGIRSGRTGYAWVINDTGLYLYHPDAEFIGRDAVAALRDRCEKEGLSGQVNLDEIVRIMRTQMRLGREGTGSYASGWHRERHGATTKLIAFKPTESRGLTAAHIWSVAVVAPIDEVADKAREMYFRHYAAGGAIVLGVLIFGFLIVMYQYRISQALQQQVERTEASLQEAERTCRRVIEQATDLIYIFDLEARVVMLNPQAIELFSNLVITRRDGGVLPDDTDPRQESSFVGYRIEELMRPRDASFVHRKIDQVLAEKRNISYEHSIPVKDRTIRLSTRLVPMRDDRSEIQYLMGISRDITEQVEMDQRIYNAEKLASIGTLAAGVAHEINNPLAVILGFTDLLLEEFEPGSARHDDLKVIETNANNAKKIVENLLTFARVTEGLVDTLDVQSSVETVLKIAKNTLLTKKIELATDLPDNLPRVQGDSRELQQVIFNLINNSVAAMDRTGGTLSVSARAEDGWVHVEVADTGEGIPDRIKGQIFDPFFTTKKVGEGTGLGLSLCYGIVRKYGGKISFTSVSAEDCPNGPTGTTFTVSMPIDKRVSRPKGGA